MRSSSHQSLEPNIGQHGCQLLNGGATHLLEEFGKAIDLSSHAGAGARISGNSELSSLLGAQGQLGEKLTGFLPTNAQPLRAILFDKSNRDNWVLGWHQDRTICVDKRIPDLEGFGPWTTKQGLTHVEPPFRIIDAMRTIRIHFDRVTNENAPLKVAVGSHRIGKIRADEVEAVASKFECHKCLAERGDVWLYATPILHASDASISSAPRRVLQVDYSAEKLPSGLNWLGV